MKLEAKESDRLQLLVGDITKLRVDAIVNAANESLRGGGGVDGAIHRAAGPGLLRECIEIRSCPAGEARITKGYLLPARFVIHTVGPIWQGGDDGEHETLASCYRSSLALAVAHGAQCVALPCIATGIYGFPKAKACEIAVASVREWLSQNPQPAQVVFCCYEKEDAELYRTRLGIAPLNMK